MGIIVIEERFKYKEYVDKRRTQPKRRYIAKAQCDCGIIFYPFLENVTRGLTTGCTACRNKRHNGANTKLYKVWSAMKQRCYNAKDQQYSNYGARGIQVCIEWIDSFEAYKIYVESLPKPKTDKRLSLDRINNNGNYEPGNLRWATDSEQSLNNRNSLDKKWLNKQEYMKYYNKMYNEKLRQQKQVTKE